MNFITKPKDYDNGINFDLKLKKAPSTVMKKPPKHKKQKKSDCPSGVTSPTKKSTVDLGVLTQNLEIAAAQIESRKKGKQKQTLSQFIKKEIEEIEYLKNIESVQEYDIRK
jgi:hypothetical protein